MKKASDLFKELLEKFVSGCNKAKKKEKNKFYECILKEAEETFFSSKLAAEAFELYSKQIKKQQVTLLNLSANNKDYLKEYQQTIINSLSIITLVSSPELDRVSLSLKQVIFHFMEIPTLKEHVLTYHLEFCISNLSFTTSFDFGYKLMDVIFKHSKRDGIFIRCQERDCLHKIIEVFAGTALDLIEESRFRTEVINFLNLVLNQIDDYEFQTFPNELHKLMNRLLCYKQEDDFIVNLIQKLTNISEKKIRLKKESEQSMVEAVVSTNPFNEVLSKFAAKVLTPRNPVCEKIDSEIYRKMLMAVTSSLIVFDDLSFFDLMSDISEKNYEENKDMIFSELGNFISDICSKLSKASTGDLVATKRQIDITRKLVSGTKGSLMDFGPSKVIECIKDYIIQIGQKLTNKNVDHMGEELLPIVIKSLEQFDKINQTVMEKFFFYLSHLVVSEKVFGSYRKVFIDKLFDTNDQKDMHKVLSFYHSFFKPVQKNQFLKQFISEMLMSLKVKEKQNTGWPITYELIQFSLEIFEKKDVEHLREMRILNTILRIFQLFKMFAKRREESQEIFNAMRFNSPILNTTEFSDRKLFCQIVEKIQKIFRNDIQLINDFSDLRGYEKICQDAAYYIETDNDAMVVIQFLTSIAYQVDRPVMPQFQTLNKRGVDHEHSSKRVEYKTMMVSNSLDRSTHGLIARNTLRDCDNLGVIQLKDLHRGIDAVPSINLSLLNPEIDHYDNEAILVVPQIIYSIVLYLLERAPINFRENYMQTFLHHAETRIDNFEKMREGRIFYALAYTMLDKEGLELEDVTQNRIMTLFKRRPTQETYRLLYDHYFARLVKQTDKDYDRLSRVVQFDDDSQCQFAEYMELTNHKHMQNHYVVVPSSTSFYQPQYLDKSMNLQLESVAYSMWLCRNYKKESNVRFTIFNVFLLFNEAHKRKIELYWVGDEIRLRYTLSNVHSNQGSEHEISMYKDDMQRLASNRPIHVIFQLEFSASPNRLRTTLYIDGIKINTEDIPELGSLNAKIGKNAKKKEFQAYCSYGYNEMELKEPNNKDLIEKTRVREVFLMSGTLTNQEVQLLYSIYCPHSKVTLNWFNDTHTVNLRNINSELKELFELMNKNGSLKLEELKLPDRPLSFFVKLNTPYLYTKLEFLIQGIADPIRPDNTPAEGGYNSPTSGKLQRKKSSETQPSAQRSKLKLFLQSSYNVSAIIQNKIISSSDIKLAYLVYFNSKNRVNNPTIIKTAFWSEPSFDFIIRSECILERYLAFFESSHFNEIVEVLRRDGLRTFQAAALTNTNSSYNMPLLYILLNKVSNLPRDLIVGIVGLFGIKSKDSDRDINRSSSGTPKESTHLLIDPHGICLLFSIFIKNQWHKKLHLLLRTIRLTYLKESPICQ